MRNIPFNNPQPNSIPQPLQSMKHRLPRFFLIHRRRHTSCSTSTLCPCITPRRFAQSIACFFTGPAAVQIFFLPQGEIGGYTVSHGDELDEEEVQAGRVYEGEGGVDVGCCGRVGGGVRGIGGHFGGRCGGRSWIGSYKVIGRWCVAG